MATRATMLELKTRGDLLALPDDGNRYELIAGEITMSPAPKIKHQRAVKLLLLAFETFLAGNRMGEVVVSPCDVQLSPFDVVQPDLFVVRTSGRATVTEDLVVGPPDLVVEVLSTAGRSHDLVRKAALYLRAGVPEYWVVDPEATTITVNVLRDGLYVADLPEDGIARSRVLPGLEVDPTEVFRMPEGLGNAPG